MKACVAETLLLFDLLLDLFPEVSEHRLQLSSYFVHDVGFNLG
jgi:hypothetical protein